MFGYSEVFLKEINGYLTAQEIMQQPRLWKETFRILKENRTRIQDFLGRLLPQKDLRIIFTGAGTSAYIGECIVPYLEKKLNRSFESIATTDIVTHPEHYLRKTAPTLLISCARSGDSPESLATVELADTIVNELFHIVITCNNQGQLARQAAVGENKLLILMPEEANDQAFAMTGSFTTMLLSSLGIFNLKSLDKIENDMDYVIELSQTILNDKVEEIKKLAAKDYNRAIFLGSASLHGLAKESCLKNLELTNGQIMAISESSLGFRHGPKTAINEKTLVLSFLSNNQYARQYELDLLRELAIDEGNKLLAAVTNNPDRQVEAVVDQTIYISEKIRQYDDDIYLIFNYILIAQMLAFFKSITLGITPDNPCPNGNANRVVKGVTIYPY